MFSGGYENVQQGEIREAIISDSQNRPISAYPQQIEIFSANPFLITLPEGQKLIPLPTDDTYKSLSAILMDEDYIQLTKEHRVLSGDTPLLDAIALICLKIAAYKD